MVKPTECSECRELFMANSALQLEMQHIAVKQGPEDAESELNDRLEGVHEDHNDGSIWSRGE